MTGKDLPRLTERPASPNPSPLPLLDIPGWDELGLVAGMTGLGDDCSFGLASPDSAATITANWQGFRTAMRPRFSRFVVGLQCHGTEIAFHENPEPGWLVLDEVDGHVTATPGLLLTVTVADCVPCYMAHPASGTVALLHAGWRGTAKRMLEEGVAALTARACCSASDILIHLGISICNACYEVDSEVFQAVSGREVDGPVHLDLRAELARRAEACGVGRVSASSWCTRHDGRHFHSYRRDGVRAGRGIAYLGRPHPATG